MIRKLLASAVAGFGLVASANAAPTLTLNYQLVAGTSGSTIINAGADGKYHLLPGDEFRLRVNVLLTNPYTTHPEHYDSFADDFLPVASLGLRQLNVEVTTPGSDGVIIPKTGAVVGGVPQWANYLSAVPGAPTFSNLITRDGDADLDATGLGFLNTSASLSSAAQVAGYQLGVTSLRIAQGVYQAPKAGTANLVTSVVNANAYADFLADDALDTVNLLATSGVQIVNGNIQIVVEGGTTPVYKALASNGPASDPALPDFAYQYHPMQDPTLVLPAGTDKGEIQFGDLAVTPAGSLYALFWLEGTPADIAAVKAQFANISEATGDVVENVGPGPIYDNLVANFPGFNMALRIEGMASALDGGSLAFDFSGNNGLTVAKFAAVPEPASLLALGGLSFLGLTIGRRRR